MGARSGDKVDREMMRRALRIARSGHPSPNPHVGAVLVKDGTVVSRGFHQKAGTAHAEVAAIQAAPEGAAKGATLYVTFEPCNHFGRTGPCTDAIVRAGIRRVVIGCADPAPHVPGAVGKLEQARIEVTQGVLKEEACELVADFVKHHTQKVPFVTLKAAASLDGKLAAPDGTSRWLTGEAARRRVHQERAYSDAVLVGVGTVLADDPRLNVRRVQGPAPLTVVVDSLLRTPPTSRLLLPQAERKPVIFHGSQAPEAARRELKARGAQLVEVGDDAESLCWNAILCDLGQRDVVRLLVEGGARIFGSLLRQRHADRLLLFLAPLVLGSTAKGWVEGPLVGTLKDAGRFQIGRVHQLGDDLMLQVDLSTNKLV